MLIVFEELVCEVELLLCCAIAIVASFLTTFLVMPPIMKFLKNKGIIGIDVHKPDKPEVPEMGGIGIVLGLFVGVLALIHVGDYAKYLAFLTTVAVTALIGLVDDLYTLRAKVKTGLTVLAFTPLVLFALLFPSQIVLGRPELPFIGRLRLTIVYWLLLPFAIAVPANAVNMMDTYNGVMSGSCAMALLSLMTVSYTHLTLPTKA